MIPNMTGSTALVAAVAIVAMTGCGDSGSGSDSAEVAVLTGFYPYAFVAARVGGGRVAVQNLTKPGAEPHDLELTPQQVGEVGDSDLVIYSEGFQPAVDEAIELAEPGAVLEVTEVVSDDLAGDPHLWLDPTKLAEVADATAERLADLDPDGEADYRTNAKALRGALEDLDADFQARLSSCERTTFVVNHEAFGYLAAAYGLEQVGISGLSPESEPSPTGILEVQETVEAAGITTIFYEPLASPEVAEALAIDLGVKTAVLDPLEGLAEDSVDDYISVMRENLAALEEANGCT